MIEFFIIKNVHTGEKKNLNHQEIGLTARPST